MEVEDLESNTRPPEYLSSAKHYNDNMERGEESVTGENKNVFIADSRIKELYITERRDDKNQIDFHQPTKKDHDKFQADLVICSEETEGDEEKNTLHEDNCNLVNALDDKDAVNETRNLIHEDETEENNGEDEIEGNEIKRAFEGTGIFVGSEEAITSLLDRELSKKEEEDENENLQLTPLARFRRAASRVRFMCRVQINLNQYATEAGKGAFGGGMTDMVNKLQESHNIVYMQENADKSKEAITFHAGDFKAKCEFTLPKKAIHILEKRPEDRTKEDIRQVGNLMRGLHSFRKYTRATQDLICKVVRYQKYGRRRVVVRKGHIGYSFYFIFSGTCCVTLDEDEESVFTKKEVTVMKKGTSFGEIALLKDVKRKATIMCIEETELLVVDADDFFENGLDAHIHQDFQYRHDFFRTLNLFSTWPSEHLQEVSDMGRLEEYNHDSVVVKDAREDDWLLFVSKGRCDVLKLVDLAELYTSKLKAYKAVTSRAKKLRERSASDLLRGDYPLSLLPEGYQSQFPWMIPTSLPERPKTTGQITNRFHEQEREITKCRSKSANIRTRSSATKADDKHFPELSTKPEKQPMHARSTDSVLTTQLPHHLTMGMQTMKGPGVEAGVYIQVDSLGPGECFGLQKIKGEMPRLSLLSLGCEVIRVSMSKFKEYADEQTYEKVQGMIPTYPCNQDLWDNFRKKHKWNTFKNGIVQDVLTNHAQAMKPNTFARDLRSKSAMASVQHGVSLSRRNNETVKNLKSSGMSKISYNAEGWVNNAIHKKNKVIKRHHLGTNYSTAGTSIRSPAHGPRPKTSGLHRSIRTTMAPSDFPTIHKSTGYVTAHRPIRSTISVTGRSRMLHNEHITKTVNSAGLQWRSSSAK